MKTFIALFRGINVGGNNILPMHELKSILDNIGLKNVKTYMQSGNVVIQTERKTVGKLAKEIGLTIKSKYNFEPKIIFLKQSELQEIIDANPFRNEEGKFLYFFFLASTPANPDLARIESYKSKTEEYKLVNRVFYLFAPEGSGRSKLASNVESILGVAATARNRNTVDKLLKMVSQ